MFCNNCGTNNQEGVQFCANCGTALQNNGANNAQQPTYQTYQKPAAQPGKGLAIASLVLGIVSFFMFAYIAGALAIIFGGVAKSKGNASPMATAGIVCGIIGIALMIIVTIAFQSTLGLFF